MSIQPYIYQDPQETSAACAVKILQLLEESLVKAGFPGDNVHRNQPALDPQTAAQLYAEDIREFFHLEPGALPQFDIVHRGMGPDMHTASLFPAEPLSNDQGYPAATTYVDKFHQWRIALLPGVLEGARNTIMLGAGGDKAEQLRTVLDEPYDPMKYPAQSNVVWYLDKAAARLLN